MTSPDDNDQHETPTVGSARPRLGRRAKLGLAAAGLLVIGGVGGAVVVAHGRPSVAMVPANPVAIRSLGSDEIATIRGQVAEVYGNKIIVADASGRALVDLGREGDDGQIVTAGQTVTVQGRFAHGYIRAAFLVGPDNKIVALGPLGGRRHGAHGHHGPDDDRDGPPLPPPPPGADDGAKES